MLTTLQSHFRQTTPKTIPKWSQYLESLQLQKSQLQTRFLNSYGTESRGFRILKQIIDQLDTDMIIYLEKQPDDFARYLNGFMPMQRNSIRLFQPTESGRAYRNVFYDKGIFATNEYFCPVDDVDHLFTLPFTKSWEEWDKVQPVHLWYHDSPEYSLNLIKAKVHFKYQNPSYAIIFVDVIALLFKYYKYMTTRIIGEEEKSLHNFIHNHVFKFFFSDLQNIWILNQILLCSNVVDLTQDIDAITTQIQLSNRQYGYIGGRHTEAIESLLRAFDEVRDGKVRVNSLLSFDLLPTGSVIDRIHYAFNYLDVAHVQQYKYMRILRDMPIIDLLIQMHGWRADTETYKSLTKALRVVLQRLQVNKPWSKIYDSSIRMHIKDWIDRTLDKIT